MKRLLGVTALLLALVAGAAVVAPTVISAEVVKRRIAEQITTWTGREVHFDGDPKISFAPYLRFSFGRATLAGDPAGGEPLIEMDGLRGGLRLLPLLFGRIEPTEFELIAPRINLAIDAAGRPNWLMPSIAVAGRQAEAARRSATEVAARDPGPPPDVRLGRFTVTQGRISFADRRSGRSLGIDNLNLRADWPSLATAAIATATFSWHGEPVEANLSVAQPVDLIAGTGSQVRLALASSLVRIALNGTAHRGTDFQLEGETTLTTPSLRRVAEWTGRAVEPGPTLGAAQIKGKLNWIGPSVAFSDAAVELDGNKAVGVLKVLFDGPRPKLVGTLALETLDLSAYAEGLRTTASTAGAWPAARIETAALREADFDLRVSAAQVLVGSARLTRAAASAVVDNGRLVFNLGEARAYGGRLAGSITAELTGDRIKTSAEANLDRVEVRPVLTDVTGLDGLGGIVSGSIDVTGNGASWGELAGSLTGEALLKLASCSIAGLDLGRLSTILLDPASGGTAPTSDAPTTFETVEAKFVFADGSVRTDGLVAKAKAYGISLDGTASLTVPKIAARGTLSVAKPARPFKGGAGTPIDVPFMVGGTWHQPTLSPDLDRLLNRNAGSGEASGLEPGRLPSSLLPLLR